MGSEVITNTERRQNMDVPVTLDVKEWEQVLRALVMYKNAGLSLELTEKPLQIEKISNSILKQMIK